MCCWHSRGFEDSLEIDYDLVFDDVWPIGPKGSRTNTEDVTGSPVEGTEEYGRVWRGALTS